MDFGCLRGFFSGNRCANVFFLFFFFFLSKKPGNPLVFLWFFFLPKKSGNREGKPAKFFWNSAFIYLRECVKRCIWCYKSEDVYTS